MRDLPLLMIFVVILAISKDLVPPAILLHAFMHHLTPLPNNGPEESKGETCFTKWGPSRATLTALIAFALSRR